MDAERRAATAPVSCAERGPLNVNRSFGVSGAVFVKSQNSISDIDLCAHLLPALLEWRRNLIALKTLFQLRFRLLCDISRQPVQLFLNRRVYIAASWYRPSIA